MRMEKESMSPKRDLKKWGWVTAIVGDCVGFTGAGFGLGYWWVKQFHAPSGCVLITTFLGFGVAMVRLYQLGKPKE